MDDVCDSRSVRYEFCMQIAMVAPTQGRFSYNFVKTTILAASFSAFLFHFMLPRELWEAYSNHTVCLSFRPDSCPVHISYIL